MNYLETDTAIAKEDVEFHECRAVKLHYLIYGRNAWNATWVTKYSPGCMNQTFDAAKMVAEKKRVQGSVFYIREIPAIQFVNSKLSVFITEINADSPLKHYLDLPENSDVTLMDVYEYFHSKKPNSVIRLICHATEYLRLNGKISMVRIDLNCLEPIQSSQKFKGYKSYSNGKGYYLGWSNEENKMSSSAVQVLALRFNKMIQFQNKGESPNAT